MYCRDPAGIGKSLFRQHHGEAAAGDICDVGEAVARLSNFAVDETP
jgi:hypothetical protein